MQKICFFGTLCPTKLLRCLHFSDLNWKMTTCFLFWMLSIGITAPATTTNTVHLQCQPTVFSAAHWKQTFFFWSVIWKPFNLYQQLQLTTIKSQTQERCEKQWLDAAWLQRTDHKKRLWAIQRSLRVEFGRRGRKYELPYTGKIMVEETQEMSHTRQESLRQKVVSAFVVWE